MHDEPLEEWARRRDDRRGAERQITGTRRAVPLRSGPRASHIDPDGPRALLAWNGTAWEAVGVAANAAEARKFLGYVCAPAPEGASGGRPTGQEPGTGRHRKP
ncbi:hypothetical protein K4749_27180 [Streptomyces sp. TRM72054]|uniref:DUF6087 family protein n=1 Tax=Streptomyces sp. TRM72054 TaxID=2870562 RepID=UPI001C8B4F80|nr:DUF6087 family protein [Streptomyces sp. TRM72054]MBX9397179.1 hypothetical protein [Streptomyces sp. TRM72054]